MRRVPLWQLLYRPKPSSKFPSLCTQILDLKGKALIHVSDIQRQGNTDDQDLDHHPCGVCMPTHE